MTRRGHTLEVKADEKQMTNLHCNLRNAYKVSFRGQTRDLEPDYLGWAFGKDAYRFGM